MRMTDALRTRLRDALAEADGAEPTPERARELERRVEEAAREGRCRVDFEGAASEASIAFRPYRDAESGEWRAAADGERVAELVSRAHLEAEAARGPREDGPMLVADAADGTGSWLDYNGAPAPGGPSLGTFDSRGEAALFARGVGLPLRADMAAWRAADREALRRGSAAQSLLDGPWGIRGEEVHGVIDAAERAWRMLGASRPLDWIASILADALAETEGRLSFADAPRLPEDELARILREALEGGEGRLLDECDLAILEIAAHPERAGTAGTWRPGGPGKEGLLAEVSLSEAHPGRMRWALYEVDPETGALGAKEEGVSSGYGSFEECAEYVLGCPSVAFAHPGKPTSSDLAPPARGAGRRGLGERMDDARREADQRGSAPKGTEGREAR